MLQQNRSFHAKIETVLHFLISSDLTSLRYRPTVKFLPQKPNSSLPVAMRTCQTDNFHGRYLTPKRFRAIHHIVGEAGRQRWL